MDKNKQQYQHRYKRGQGGFSLIELMIALVLGLIIVGAVINAFLAMSQTYKVQDALSRAQESGRFALELVSQELRMAGFTDTAQRALIGYPQVTAQASLPSAVDDQVNDAVTSEMLFIDTHDSGGGLALYVAPDGQSGISTLYAGTQALVEGVASIIFSYGLDTNNDFQVDRFAPSSTVGIDWTQVVAVRVWILAVGGERGAVDTAQTLAAPFAAVDTSDRRLYQAFATTIALRNALLDKP
ncbi:PilW family protein [Neptunomonas antarctica]|nr:PilW family protein [Neptunomonas antarctica]